MPSAEIQCQLPPVTDSVPEARHLLDDLGEMVSPGKLEHLRLLVTELVTNSVCYAGLTEDESIGLTVSVEERLIRVEVRDGGPGFDKPFFGSQPPDQTGGRGLYLVELLSDRWGVEQGNPVCVWFEVADDA